MIAVWMLFSMLCGALVVAAGALLEPVVASAARPRRGLWTVVVLCTALVVLLPLVRPASPLAHAGVAEVEITAPAANLWVAGDVATNNVVDNAALWAAVGWQALRERTNRWNAALVGAWGAVGVTLLAFIVIGARARSIGSTAVPSLTHDALGHEVVLSAVGGPAATGVLRPRILLPPWTLDLDPPLRAIVLRHEAEHIAARDPALLLGAVLLLVLLPWQLPLWYAVRRLKIAIEVDCDARVLHAFPDVRRYARLLLLVSQQFHTTKPSFRAVHAGLTTLGSARSHLRTRILVMTGSPARRFTFGSIAQLGGAVGLAAAVAAMPAPAVRNPAAVPITHDLPVVAPGRAGAGAELQPPQKRVPPAPPTPATAPTPPRVVRPPSPPLPVQAPPQLQFKKPSYKTERAQSRKSARQQLVRSQRDLEERLRIVRGQLAWVDSERDAAAFESESNKPFKAKVSPEIEVKMLRKVLEERRGRDGEVRKLQKQLDKSTVPKFKRPDSTRYDGRRQDTNVVPRT